MRTSQARLLSQLSSITFSVARRVPEDTARCLSRLGDSKRGGGGLRDEPAYLDSSTGSLPKVYLLKIKFQRFIATSNATYRLTPSSSRDSRSGGHQKCIVKMHSHKNYAIYALMTDTKNRVIYRACALESCTLDGLTRPPVLALA